MELSDLIPEVRPIPILVGASFGLIVAFLASRLTSEIGSEVEAVEFSLILLQLTALALPALAILLQASLNYSTQKRFRLAGQTTNIQFWLFGLIGLASFSLATCVYLLTISLDLQNDLFIPLVLVNIALLCFAGVPIVLAVYEYTNRNNPFTDAVHAVELAKMYDDVDDLDGIDRAFEQFDSLNDIATVNEDNSEDRGDEVSGKADEKSTQNVE